MVDLRIGTTEEASLEASKWLSSQILIDSQEMARLFDAMGDFHLFLPGAITKRDEGEISKQHFLQHYEAYVSSLKEGQIPDSKACRQLFSCVLTRTVDALFAILLSDDRQLIKVAKPVIQLQAHHMGYSALDGKFRSMVFGQDNITWGIQFSYPQLFRDNATKQVEKTSNASQFPNTELFQIFQKWVRSNTIPTPFSIDGQTINVPIRLGKQCLTWINHHPQLMSKGISVAC